MGPLGVVKLDPLADDPLGPEAVGQLVQVDRLVLERPPEALDEDVVHAAAPAVHGDGDIRVLERAGEVAAGELAALVGVEDLRPAVSGQRLGQGLDTEPGVHGVRQPPGQNVARAILPSNLNPNFLANLAFSSYAVSISICILCRSNPNNEALITYRENFNNFFGYFKNCLFNINQAVPTPV